MNIYNHYTIYMILNLINNKIYIGQTIQPPIRRWYAHISKSKKYNGKGTPIMNVIQKYGTENFKFIPICSCFDIDELNLRETYFIDLYNATDNSLGHNCM